MPLYEHACSCGETVEQFRKAADWNKKPQCPLCHTPMPQTYTGKNVRANYARPVHLDSMGFSANPEDVAEHREKFPGVDLAFKDGFAVPVMQNLNQKRRYLRENNWADTKDFR